MGSLGYLAAVNVVIWVGLFLYLWRLDRRIEQTERQAMKKGYWIAAALTLAFVGFGLTAFQKTLTPYLTFDEARKARGVVQVMGGLDKESDRYDTGDAGALLRPDRRPGPADAGGLPRHQARQLP